MNFRNNLNKQSKFNRNFYPNQRYKNNYNNNYYRNNQFRFRLKRNQNNNNKQIRKNTNRIRNNNNNNRYINIKTNQLDKNIKTLTKYVKNFSLGGGPLKSINGKQKKNINDPNSIKKEIRYDKLYTALEMYNMGKYYSFYKTSNMILRLAIYSTHSFVIPVGAENCGFVWFPYFYPKLHTSAKVRTSNENAKVDNMCNFYLRIGTNLTLFTPTNTDVRGNYRLISATMRIANTTTNSDKGGSYTVYRITRNDGQPIFYNSQLGIKTTEDLPAMIIELIGSVYNNEPTKYLYNANQTALCNEYGVIDGNTVFQSYYEYMGQMTNQSTANYTLPAGGHVSSAQEFNPQGVNVKYLAQFDPVSKDQTYKVECIQVFEVSPLSTDSIGSLAFKGDKSVTPSVIAQAKNKFNLEVAPI